MSRIRSDLSEDRARALTLTPVSRETLARLDQFVELLLQWQSRINLIAPSTIPKVWTRHVADSLQLLDLAPDARIWVDFGSGGGFPAIPVACALAERPGAKVYLIESNSKKAAFLRDVARVLALPVEVRMERAENFGESWTGKADVVSARALAPLKTLCDQAFPLIERGATGLFLKGQDIDIELTGATKYWKLSASKSPSKTSSEGCIVVVRGLERRIKGDAAP